MVIENGSEKTPTASPEAHPAPAQVGTGLPPVPLEAERHPSSSYLPWGWKSKPASPSTLRLERHPAPDAPEHQMVHELDADQRRRIGHPPREQEIRVARRRIAARVGMEEHDGGGAHRARSVLVAGLQEVVDLAADGGDHVRQQSGVVAGEAAVTVEDHEAGEAGIVEGAEALAADVEEDRQIELLGAQELHRAVGLRFDAGGGLGGIHRDAPDR